ncbi:hypothetical protein HPB51_027444 [Rhipicephalus microplus]|uniref:Uncharacterized protein n=1 Tax=Rhipicephalus microplus TaxID=6941 RepID=A0A9J6D023_RHIMP|nr:hypothetical protein HPB51_027444 [Rhipicephalus microplus]
MYASRAGTSVCLDFLYMMKRSFYALVEDFPWESWRQVPEPVLVPLVVESWRRVPEPALAPLFQEGWSGFPRRTAGAQGPNSLPPEHVCRRLQFVDSGAEPLEFDAATLRLPTSSLQVTTPHNVDFATEWCRRGINDGPGYYPDDLNCAQGPNSLPPEHVCRRLQFVDSGAEPLEFDAATLRLPTSSLQVTTPHNVDFATEWCRRGINDGPGYYPDDLNLWASPPLASGTHQRQSSRPAMGRPEYRWRTSGSKDFDLATQAPSPSFTGGGTRQR